YDLATDPLETTNRAGAGDAAAAERRLAREAERKWDATGLREAILESQRARRQGHAALIRGRLHPWAFQPRHHPATQYFRNYGCPDPERPMHLPARRVRTSS